ncbi:MAG TPA: hypothetical protein VL728_19675 [Cyclobacteriaceae bacterium]|jgi:hypothetical protein|nr:hypothetical protein [Cyclobacteriaceae bacterium]
MNTGQLSKLTEQLKYQEILKENAKQNEAAKRIWHLNYLHENYDPLTNEKKPSWKEEKEWLADQGLTIVNGELVEINK